MFNATCKDYKILNMEVCFLSEGTTLDTVDLDNTCERNMIMNNYDEFVDATINHNYNNVIIVMGKDARYIKRGFYLCGDGRIFKIDDSGDSHVFSINESKLIKMFNATCKDYKKLNVEVCFLSEGTTLDSMDLDNTCERNMIMNNYDEFVDAAINHNYNNVIIVMGKDARYIKRGFYLCGDGRIFKIDDSGDSHVFSIYESKLIFNSINDFNNNDYLGDIIERTNVKLIGEMCEECAGLIAKAYKFTGIIAKAYKFKGDETSNIFVVSNYDDIIEHSKGYDIIKIFDDSGVDIAELWYFQHLDNKPLVLMRWNRA